MAIDNNWQEIFKNDPFNKRRWAQEDACYVCEGQGCEKCYFIGGYAKPQTEKEIGNESNSEK